MFTPQRKLWSLMPKSVAGPENGSVSGPGSTLNTKPVSPRTGETSAKGKAVAFLKGDGIMDQESLTERVSKLENELFEYQYNMGLLLIEKKEWTSTYEELKQALTDAADSLKREQGAHASAMLEVEKREENLKKALGVERQCVHELEKAIREMRSEHAEIKFNADSKLAEANVLATSVEEKSLEVESKLHAANAKLAEVSRKSSEIERKYHELEAQENALQRERSFLSRERESHDIAISKQREDLRVWERKLQEAEGRLADGRRFLNQREERANEIDKNLKEKQNELAELRKKIEIDNSALKSKEDDISSRLASVALKEKEADDIKNRLEDKEKQLLEWEEKLNAREKLEIQKLLVEHQNTLAEKQKNFELEMEQKRQLNDEELKNKVVEMDKKEGEIKHMEEKLKKREQIVEKKLEKLREKEMDVESKSEALKERERSLKDEVKDLENERKQLLADKEDLLSVKVSLENLKTDNEKLQLRLSEERDRLKVTEDERKEHARLQSELKEEIEKYRFQSEQLTKEADDLKREKERFEKEWEELDARGVEIKKEQEYILEQTGKLEKLRQSEEERLQNQKLETECYVQMELEALKLEKDSFAATMEHEKSTFHERLESEKCKLSHDFEMQKQEFMAQMQREKEELEASVSERAKLFEQERERELSNINFLREVAGREMKEMELERLRVEKERKEISQNKKHVEDQQAGIKKDIDELVAVSQKLKAQREQFIGERERFVVFAEKQRNCNICGETVREFLLSDLHPLKELEGLEALPLPLVAENYLKESTEGTANKRDAESSPVLVSSIPPTAGGTISWLRKCTTKIFKFSPGKRLELDNAQDRVEASTLPMDHVIDATKTSPFGEKESRPSLQVVNDAADVEIVRSGNVTREDVEDQDPSKIPENSQNFDLKVNTCGASEGDRVTRSRKRSGKEVFTGFKTNGNAENSVYTNGESPAGSDHVGVPQNRRKRNRVDGSRAAVSDNRVEGQSESMKDGDHLKRHQRHVAEKNQSQKRYNLRPTNRSVGTVANGSLPQVRKGKEKTSDQLPAYKANQSGNVECYRTSREKTNDPEAASPISRRSECGDGDELVRSTELASEFSAQSSLKNSIGKYVNAANTSIYDRVMSEEVNGEREYSVEIRSESRGEEVDGVSYGQEDDDDVNHPGQVSIGKKFWTFLTT